MRRFCETCDSSLTYRHAGRSDELDVSIASHDEPATLKPRYHLWVREKLPLVKIADRLPQFETVPSVEAG
jgi:hypothetical protein